MVELRRSLVKGKNQFSKWFQSNDDIKELVICVQTENLIQKDVTTLGIQFVPALFEDTNEKILCNTIFQGLLESCEHLKNTKNFVR